MYTEGPASPVLVWQTPSGNYAGSFPSDENHTVFGPYPLEELVAVMADWLDVEIGKVKRELDALRP